MKKIFNFNNIVYKGKIERDFFWFCCKKKWILLFCFFRNCFLKFISLGSTKVENYYNKTKFSYLSKFIALDDITKEFAKKNSRKLTTWYKDHYNENNIICERIPLFLIKEFVKKEKIIAYELDNKYCVNFTKFNYDLKNNGMQFSEGFFNNCTVARSVNSIYKYRKIGNLYIEIKKNNKIVCILYKILLPIILSFILFFITFGFTSVFIDIKMIYSYLIDYRLVILNILPILVFILILLFATKRYDFSFAITSFLIFIIGIINKTKLFYRDDVLKFEDITLINEAKIMLETYNIIIRWYNILSIIFCVFIILLLKKYYKKIKIKLKYRLIVIILLLFGSIYLYKNLYANDTLYNSVGNQNIINVWISTRQSQVRGLIYPLIHSISEVSSLVPESYDEDIAKEILSSYKYEHIPESKKVNIIAIMLEAYNDFSKFDTIEFTNNVYEPLHKIKKQSLSGELFVNIYGGGTIDTERKFITGYNNLSNMRKPTNSYARYFKNEGYDVVAMHPGYGVFYNRNTVNYNLGFDNYWNYENTFNKYTGWRGYASDSELFQMIFDDLKNSNSNNKPYFNFTVTYQNHGPYSDFTFDESYILIKNYAEKTYNVFNTYLSGIQETNTAIYSLYNLLKDYEEPTILILFGDHNPSLGEEKSVYYDLGINVDMSSFEGYKNVYTVPYFIYGNNAAKKVFNKSFVGMLETISPNYLMNELFNYIGFSGNEYLQYTNDVKEKIDVISSAYYKENGEYVNMQNTNYQDLLDELKNVTYYWANDAGIQN